MLMQGQEVLEESGNMWPDPPTSGLDKLRAAQRMASGDDVLSKRDSDSEGAKEPEEKEDKSTCSNNPVSELSLEDRIQMMRLTRQLVDLRTNSMGFTKGLCGNSVRVSHVNSDAGVIVYHRWDEGGAGDDVIVIVNFSRDRFPRYKVGAPQGGVWKVRLDTSIVDVTSASWHQSLDQAAAFRCCYTQDGFYDQFPVTLHLSDLKPVSMQVLSMDPSE